MPRLLAVPLISSSCFCLRKMSTGCLAEAAQAIFWVQLALSAHCCAHIDPAPLTHTSPTDNFSHFHQPLLLILVSALSPKCTDPLWVMQTATYLLTTMIPCAASWGEWFHEEDTLQCKWYLKTPTVMLRHPSQLCLTLTSSLNATSCKIKMPFNTPVTGMVFSRSEKIFQSLCCTNVLSSWVFFSSQILFPHFVSTKIYV